MGPDRSSNQAGRGRFVVVDGVDGCGKSTQARRLASALSDERGVEALHLREPGSTRAGERVREIFLDRELTIGPAAEALLVVAARRQMLEERVAPALSAGRDVVCERFHPSTYAYQGEAGGLGGREVLALCRAWAGSPAPDLVVLLELDTATALERRGGASDRIEARSEEFHRSVEAGYRRYADEVADCVVVDGRGAEDDVHQRMLGEVHRACAKTD